MKTFIIHLERAKARRPQVKHILEKTPNSQVLHACDGATLSHQEKANFYPGQAFFKPRYPFALSPGELGCFQSHRAAWREIVDQNLQAALIVEDDIQIDSALFDPALALAKAHIDVFGFIQFQVRDIRGEVDIVARDKETKLVRPQLVPVRMSAQLISQKAARRLLEMSDHVDRPVDSFIQMRWETGVDIACVVPSGVTDRTEALGGSTLQTKRGLLSELKVTLPRLRYKSAIKRLSARS